MRFSARETFFLLAAAVTINAVLWLDSLDGYLSARYHLQLSANLPEFLFEPSRQIAALLRTDGGVRAAGSAAHRDETALVTATPANGANAAGSAPASAVESPAPGEGPRVLFAGDSMMQGLAPFVISSLRKTYPKGYFSDQSKQSTGLTFRRYFDWPAKIKDEIARQKFDTVVVFLGPNDPWDINEDGKRYIFASEGWIEKYRSRVADVLEYSKANNVRVVWVGLPNMRDDRIRKGAVVGNKVFLEETLRYGFAYLPSEKIVGPLDEPFHKHVADPAKGNIAVRADDGIHFTPAGLRMISTALVDVLKVRWQ